MKALWVGMVIGAVITLLYRGLREEKPLNTTEWVERMKRAGLGIREVK